MQSARTDVSDVRDRRGIVNLRQISAYWPVLAASVMLLVVVFQALQVSLRLNDGHLVYGLDDAYIHMSIAKNFSQHGVWGVTRYGFTSSTSSPLWTLMLSAIYVFTGASNAIPYILNVLSGIGVIVAADRLLRRSAVPSGYRFVVLMAVIVLTPLNTLILSGMEHVLHILLAIVFLDSGAELLSRSRDELPALSSWESTRLLLFGALVGTVRYEGLFLVAILCVLLAFRRRFVHAFLLGIVSVTPAVLYGLIAVGQGWEFFPASLTVKSSAADYLANATWEARFQYLIVDTFNVLANQHILSLVLLAAMAVHLFRYARRAIIWERGSILLLVFILITPVNVRLVSWPDPGAYARYEAYLVVLALIVIPVGLGGYLPTRFSLQAWPVFAVAAVLLLFVVNDIYGRYRFVAYENPVVTGTNDIYRQQHQMGHFLAQYYEGATVAANDIGAINYFANIDTVDLWGLGTIEVAHLRRENRYDTAAIRSIAEERGVEIAVIYRPWLDLFGGVPEEWALVAQWKLGRAPVILGHDTVSFYAIQPEGARALAAHLRDYSARLPEGVIVLGLDEQEVSTR